MDPTSAVSEDVDTEHKFTTENQNLFLPEEDETHTKLQCSYEGTQEVNLKRHIESKHGTTQYCCKLCDAKTKGLWYIETHLKKVHNILKADYNQYLFVKELSPHGSVDYKTMSEEEHDDDEECLIDPSELLDQSLVHDDMDEEEEEESEIDPSDFLGHTDDEDMTDASSFLEPSVEINEIEENGAFIDTKRKLPSFACNQCDFVSSTSGTLTRHVNVVHKGVRWSRKVCDYVANVKCSMIRHVQSIHLGWRYKCKFCPHVATQKGGLKYHIEKKHPGSSMASWIKAEPIKMLDQVNGGDISTLEVNQLYEEFTEVSQEPIRDPEEEIPSNDDSFQDVNDEDASAQYVGEDHDFSEMFAKFISNGETEVQCELCTYSTSRIGNMKRHVSASHQGIRFPCKLCHYKAPDKGSLMRHNRGVHQGIKFYCDFCSYSASQKGNLKKHVEMKHPDIEYSCPYCNYKVNWKGSIMKHINNNHSDLMVIHGVTSNSLSDSLLSSSSNESTPKKVKKEEIIEMREDPFKSYKHERVKEDSVVVETDVKNNSNINTDSFYDPANMSFSCPDCDYKASSAASLARHHGAVHKGIRWKCKECDFITRDKSSLKRHRRNRHDGLRFQCNYCDYDAGQKSNLKSHMDRKHPEVPYDHTQFQQVRVERSRFARESTTRACQELSNFSNLDQHLSSLLTNKTDLLNSSEDSGIKADDDEEDVVRVTANNCDGSYDDIAEESEEEMTPELTSTPVKHDTTSVNKLMSANSILMSALQSPTLTPRQSIIDNITDAALVSRSITADSLLHCNECDFSAKSQGTLFRHVQAVHRGVRFSCDFCDFVTIDKGSLKRHVNGQHHGIKHKCDFCNYENAQMGNVRKHIETKHQNLVYHCPYCKVKAKQRWYLDRHVKKQHMEKIDDFDVKTVVAVVDQPSPDESQSKKFSSQTALFLEMFGNHPMAQFFVPDTDKTGDDGVEESKVEETAA